MHQSCRRHGLEANNKINDMSKKKKNNASNGRGSAVNTTLDGSTYPG